MKTSSFSFELPEHLIAQYPSAERDKSRIFVLDRQSDVYRHAAVLQLADFLEPGTVVVRNNSRVRKARIYARREDTKGEVEFLFLRQADPCTWHAITSKTKRQHPGSRYLFPGNITGMITGEHHDDGCTVKTVQLDQAVGEAYFTSYGHMPLPPYIRREDGELDEARYQTAYAKIPGSAAAPTAGLHFTNEVEASLLDKSIEIVEVTLHVGLGTFLPIRSDDIEDHRIHSETCTLGEDEADKLNRAKHAGRKIAAVGTTSMRTLETMWNGREFLPGTKDTSLYITPGYDFGAVDILFTNFHTPKSSLLVLVAAFAGYERTMAAYKEAVRLSYRFYSYGDAMLIL